MIITSYQRVREADIEVFRCLPCIQGGAAFAEIPKTMLRYSTNPNFPIRRFELDLQTEPIKGMKYRIIAAM